MIPTMVLLLVRYTALTSSKADMISEVVNALFLTYVASEYLVAEDNVQSRQKNRRALPHSTIVVGIFVVLVNILDRVTGALFLINDLLEGFLHLPRVLFAAVAYVVALFVDINRRGRRITLRDFLPRVGVAFLKVLPAYPFLAVMISFVFMFVINLWEALHLPLEWLNAPIYFGTLYGPFAWVYLNVKRTVIEEQSSLPV
jgi:hypothetical protein